MGGLTRRLLDREHKDSAGGTAVDETQGAIVDDARKPLVRSSPNQAAQVSAEDVHRYQDN